MSIDPTRFAEIQARCASATPPPWKHSGEQVYSPGGALAQVPPGFGEPMTEEGRKQQEADYSFIAHAREDLVDCIGALEVAAGDMVQVWIAAMTEPVPTPEEISQESQELSVDAKRMLAHPLDVIDTIVGFRTRIRELEAAIKEVISEKGDDLCWMDAFTKLGALVGIKFKPEMLPREQMLANCARFVDSLLAGEHYETPEDNGWIPVEESLPEPYSNKVQVYVSFTDGDEDDGSDPNIRFNDNHPQFGARYQDRWRLDNELFAHEIESGRARVTHWRRVRGPK